MKKLRTDGKQRHRKESQSRQPDDRLHFRCIMRQVNRHLPILTFLSVMLMFLTLTPMTVAKVSHIETLKQFNKSFFPVSV